VNFPDRTRQLEQYDDLQEAKYVLENLLDSSADSIGVVDANGRFARWNEASEEIFGYSAAEMQEKHFSELYEDPAELEIMLTRLRRDGFVRKYEINMKKKDGSIAPFNLSINLLYDRQHNLTGSLCIARDRSDTRRALAELQMLNERLENEITERKLAEESIKENLRVRQQILDTIPCPIFYQGIDGRLQGVNHSFLQFYGKTLEQVLGKTVHEVFSKEIADKYFQSDQDLLQHPGTQVFEFYTYDAQGQRRETAAHKATFVDKSGALAGLAGIIFDITEQRQTDKILKHLLHQTQLILDSTAEGILGLDIESKHVFVNPAATRMLGYEEGELVGFRSHPIWHHSRPDGTPYPEEECPIYKYLKSGVAHYAEDVFWRKDGSSFPVDFKGNPIIEDGKIIGAVVTFWDISERQRTEEALRQSEQTYRSLVQTIPAVVFKGYEDWSVDFFDDKIEEIMGYRKEEFDSRRMKWSDVILPEDFQNAKNVVRQALITNKSYLREYKIKDKKGKYLWIQERGQIICDKDNNIDYINGVLFNITEMKKFEEDHLMFTKLESLGILAGGIAHDFNNILTAITGYLSLAMLDPQMGERSRGRLTKADQACQQAQTLARQLLTFAKGGAPIKELVSLEKLVAESASLACRGSRVRCELTFLKELHSKSRWTPGKSARSSRISLSTPSRPCRRAAPSRLPGKILRSASMAASPWRRAIMSKFPLRIKASAYRKNTCRISSIPTLPRSRKAAASVWPRFIPLSRSIMALFRRSPSQEKEAPSMFIFRPATGRLRSNPKRSGSCFPGKGRSW
jgi:PAS domain S-box-containing protein